MKKIIKSTQKKSNDKLKNCPSNLCPGAMHVMGLSRKTIRWRSYCRNGVEIAAAKVQIWHFWWTRLLLWSTQSRFEALTKYINVACACLRHTKKFNAHSLQHYFVPSSQTVRVRTWRCYRHAHQQLTGCSKDVLVDHCMRRERGHHLRDCPERCKIKFSLKMQKKCCKITSLRKTRAKGCPVRLLYRFKSPSTTWIINDRTRHDHRGSWGYVKRINRHNVRQWVRQEAKLYEMRKSSRPGHQK